MLHLVFVRGFSPLFFLLLFNIHFTQYNSCLALEYLQEHEIFDQKALVDDELRSRRFVEVNERSLGNEQDLEYASIVNRDRRQPDGFQLPIDQFPQLNDNNVGQWVPDTANSRPEPLLANGISDDTERRRRRNDVLFIVIVAICTVVGVAGLVAAAIFWYRIQKRAEEALDAEYPSYGVTGPGSSATKISPNATATDRKLAQSAQMFHYQQQRQQMMAQEKSHLDAKPVHSDESDDEAPTGGDYTVYECPGLAPTGEMEVRNPLFAETNPSLTSVVHPSTNNHYPQLTTTLPSSTTSPPKENSIP